MQTVGVKSAMHWGLYSSTAALDHDESYSRHKRSGEQPHLHIRSAGIRSIGKDTWITAASCSNSRSGVEELLHESRKQHDSSLWACCAAYLSRHRERKNSSSIRVVVSADYTGLL